MKTRVVEIGAFEAKNRFSELLEQVQRGAEITITKHDRPVARLVGVSAGLKGGRKAAAATLRTLSGRYSLAGMSVRTLIDEGRR